MPSTPDSLNERFEKKIVFRLARWLPLGLGLLASVALVIALLVLVYAFSPSFAPTEPAALETPKPVTLSAEDIKQQITSPAKTEAATGDDAAAAPAAETAETSKSGPDPRAVALAAEMGRLRDLTSKGSLAFMDVTRMECTYQFYDGTCMRQREVKVQDGAANRVLAILSLYEDEGDHEKQQVDIPGTTLNITVALDSQLEARTGVLKELNGLLATAPAGKMGQWLDTWLQLRLTQEMAARKALAEQQQKAQEEYQIALGEHEATTLKKAAMRWSSMMALGMALGIFVFCGMVLAVLAIERHSRALRELAEHLRRHEDPVRPPAIVESLARET